MNPPAELALHLAAGTAARQRAIFWFAALALLLVALFHGTLAEMAGTWWHNVTYSHGFLILPISALLIWRRRNLLASLNPVPEPRALAVLLLCGMVWLIGEAGPIAPLRQLAVIGMLIGLFVLVFGRTIARAVAFPLGFLLFMVPIGDFLVGPLQDVTARFAVTLLRASGIPTFLDGYVIEIPNGVFLVAEACAGLRFLIANLVIAVLFAFLAFSRPWKRLAFIAAGAALPIIANGLRAYGIILIAHLSNNELAVGVDHLVYGWGFFTAVMIALLLIGHRFADYPLNEPDKPSPPRGEGLGEGVTPAPTSHNRLILLAGALAITAAPAYAWTMMRAPVSTAAPSILTAPIPSGWTAASPVNSWQPHFPTADRTLLTRYRSASGTVDLFVAWYSGQQPGAQLIHHNNRFDDDRNWLRIESDTAPLAAGPGLPAEARLDRLEGREGQKLVASWYWVGGRFTSDPQLARLYLSLATLTGGTRDAAVLAVATGLDDGQAAAKARLAGFVQVLAPQSYFQTRQ